MEFTSQDVEAIESTVSKTELIIGCALFVIGAALIASEDIPNIIRMAISVSHNPAIPFPIAALDMTRQASALCIHAGVVAGSIALIKASKGKMLLSSGLSTTLKVISGIVFIAVLLNVAAAIGFSALPATAADMLVLSNPSFLSLADVDTLVIALMLYGVSLIVDYAAKLQIVSDGTV